MSAVLFNSRIIHLVDGEHIDGVDFAYGYGEHYIQSAVSALVKAGYISDMEDNEMLWRYCERKGIKLTYEAVDVQRRKDL